MGLTLDSVSIIELALQHYLGQLPEASQGIGYVYKKGNTINFCLSQNGKLHFMRRLGRFSKIDQDEDHNNISLELQRTLDYCKTQLHQNTMSHMYIAPLLEELAPSFSNLTLDIKNIADELPNNEPAQCLATIGMLNLDETTD